MPWLKTPFAWLDIDCHSKRLCRIDIHAEQNQVQNTAPAHDDTYAAQVIAQLQAYFIDSHYCFNLNLEFSHATVFQRRVWTALQQIPPGQVRTYAQLATDLHTSPRAVGAACRSNPIPIVVPCHRVVATTGLGGYMGREGLAYKQWLLQHEGVCLVS
jgi:methylated-DNA-[protein]-cysteine S-methyltransferase